MLEYEGKPLHELDLEESLEFEKSLHKKILAASSAQMSHSLVEQMQGFLEQVRAHKTKVLGQMIEGKDSSGALNIGEIESESSDNTE